MTPPSCIEAAPAKINLSLHVTGQRADGYHLLDSLVVFAPEACDNVQVTPATKMSLMVTGPRAAGVPNDDRNLCWKAAVLFGEPVAITLEKHLPHAAGIGGGSADAAAVLRAMTRLFDRPCPDDLTGLGADVPVCLRSRAARMSGIGEQVMPERLPPLHGVLVNPGTDIPTPQVFQALKQKDNPPIPVRPLRPEPTGTGTGTGTEHDILEWLHNQRNDLEPPARVIAPQIDKVLNALKDAQLARMSGSGATCFGLYPTPSAADVAANRIRRDHPDWWVCASPLI